MKPHLRVRLRVHGLVQGVFFRASTRAEAERLGLVGWVRNLADGTVEAVADGPRSQLDALVDWCGRGPPGARVDRVDVEWEDADGTFERFEVRR